MTGQRAPEEPDPATDSPGSRILLDAVPEVSTDTARADTAHAVPFREFGVSDTICAALEAAGIYTTFPIQALTLPIALGGHDIIGQARTGTGKTLGFGIPLLQRLQDGPPTSPKAPRALVVVPTRELAIQVADDLRMAGSGLGTRVLTLYGGRAYEPQIEALRSGVDVVVSTPGRLLDLVGQRHLGLGDVRTLVLDEADKMLDLGFLPDVERILQLTPADRQTMMFSATMPGEVVTLARRHLRRPTHVRAETIDAPAPVPTTRQHVFRTHHLDKIEVLARVLQAEGRGLTMVFCQTKRAADQVAGALATRGFAVATVHGDLGQGQRERALRAFRSGKVDVLVATDVAARGLDVEDVTHVVNFECPDDDKAYLHRIGRTGRAGRDGVAVTFVDWRDMHRWKLIDEALGLARAEPAETYSTSDHLFTELGIPRPRPARCRGRCAAGPGWTPRPSRTSAKPGGRRSRARRTRRAGAAGRAAGGPRPPRRTAGSAGRRAAAARSRRGSAPGCAGGPGAAGTPRPPARRRRTPPLTSTNRRRAPVSRPRAARPAAARSAVPGPGGDGPGAASQRPDRHHLAAPPGCARAARRRVIPVPSA